MTTYQQRAKDYLRRVQEADIELQANRYRQEELMTIAEQCGAIVAGDRVQSTPKDDTMAEAVEALIEEQQKVAARISEWLEIKREAVQSIGKVEDLNHRAVLYYRYIMRMRLGAIAEAMHYTEDHIKTLHRNALDDLGRKI